MFICGTNRPRKPSSSIARNEEAMMGPAIWTPDQEDAAGVGEDFGEERLAQVRSANRRPAYRCIESPSAASGACPGTSSGMQVSTNMIRPGTWVGRPLTRVEHGRHVEAHFVAHEMAGKIR